MAEQKYDDNREVFYLNAALEPRHSTIEECLPVHSFPEEKFVYTLRDGTVKFEKDLYPSVEDALHHASVAKHPGDELDSSDSDVPWKDPQELLGEIEYQLERHWNGKYERIRKAFAPFVGRIYDSLREE